MLQGRVVARANVGTGPKIQIWENVAYEHQNNLKGFYSRFFG